VAENQGLPASLGPPPVAAVPPAPITGATALSGTAADSLSAGFQSTDTITVDGTVVNFSNPSNTFPAGQAATLTGTGLATGATPGFTDTGSGVSFTVQVGTGPATPVTLSDTTAGTPTTFTATQIAQAINTANGGGPIAGVTASVSNGQVVLTSAATGSSASVTVGGADGAAIFGAGNTAASGTAPTPFKTTAGPPPTLSLNPSDTVGTLVSAIDKITGTTTPSSIDGGAITINTPNAANFSITASSTTAQAALAALGFSSASGTATTTAGGTNITANATSLVNGSADTVDWYTGNNSANPRASESALVDSGISVQYGIQANEQAIRQQLQGVAVYAAVTESPTGANGAAQAAALSSRIATNLTPQPGQQQISDIQTDLANAQTTMQAASARQSQTQTVLQNMVDSTETVSTEQVASQILAIQASLSASYQTTSILSKLTLTDFLSGGLG
jgi:hypothetical protein